MSSDQNIDHILNDWPFEADGLPARLIKGANGRDLIQMRVDLGILQLEVAGRPDGTRPGGFASYLDFLSNKEIEHPDFELDEEACIEVDREFVQFYHRRVAWLRLQRFDKAVQDADHTLALMDFCREHSPCEEWTMQHEQHRAFVIFHRSQASALRAIEEQDPSQAVVTINQGLALIEENFDEMGWEDQFESDELVERLIHLREALRSDFSIEKPLPEQLEEAVATEQYELAAQLRDELAKRNQA